MTSAYDCVQISLWVCMNLFLVTAGLQTASSSSSTVPVKTARYRIEHVYNHRNVKELVERE